MITMPACTTCKTGTSVRQAHRKNYDWLLRLLGLYAFRCESCSGRFYRMRKNISPADLP